MRSFELKLAWAKHQSEVFEGQVAAWRAADGYGVLFEKHPHQAGHIIRLQVGEIAPSLPLIVGDALYSLRSALDHLAYELAGAFTNPLPPDAGERSEFPIFGNRAMTPAERNRKIGSIDPDAQAIIEALQPYARGDAYADDWLWRLHEMARVDRHRCVHLTVAQLEALRLRGENLHVEAFGIYNADPTHGNGAILGYADVRPINPDAPVNVDFTPEPQIVFKEGLLAGMPVLETLERIVEHIENEVVPALTPFLKG